MLTLSAEQIRKKTQLNARESLQTKCGHSCKSVLECSVGKPNEANKTFQSDQQQRKKLRNKCITCFPVRYQVISVHAQFSQESRATN